MVSSFATPTSDQNAFLRAPHPSKGLKNRSISTQVTYLLHAIPNLWFFPLYLSRIPQISMSVYELGTPCASDAFSTPGPTIFSVLVNPISRGSFGLQVPNTNLVSSLALTIQENVQIFYECFPLIQEGHQLQEQKSLRDYDITKDIWIHIVSRIRGGTQGWGGRGVVHLPQLCQGLLNMFWILGFPCQTPNILLVLNLWCIRRMKTLFLMLIILNVDSLPKIMRSKGLFATLTDFGLHHQLFKSGFIRIGPGM